MNESTTKRIAAIADIHVSRSDKGKWTSLFRDISAKADVLVICGDLTDTGDEEEAAVLVGELKAASIPVICVLGNHDHEKGHHKAIRQIIQNDRVHVLDGEGIVVEGIGFAGIKGFGGGFDHFMLSYFGESMMKAFVQESINEALQLDRALARIDKEHGDIPKIAVMHYAPILATVKGEPEAIYPFLGSSRLEEPLNKRKVIAAFHGHAHAGVLEGKTSEGIRVFNVAKHILERSGYAGDFFILEV
jgi:Icc-related predicted phosphoesterase